MRDPEMLAALVRERGGKVTAQRLVIWQTLQHEDSHPTAEDLYQRLKPALPTLSMTTLYNILNELVEWGDLRRFDAGDGHVHFDPDTEEHAELICMRCHSVVDVPEEAFPAPRPVLDLPTELAGYRVISRSEQYFGYCPACQAAMNADQSTVLAAR